MANRQYQTAYLPAFQPLISDNRSLAFGSIVADSYVVGQYEKIEFTIDLQATFSNAFDTSLIKLDAIITSPSQNTITVPGFYFQDYNRTIGGNFKRTIVDGVAEDHIDRLGENYTTVGNPIWKVRFAYGEIGSYSIHFVATQGVSLITSASTTFSIAASDSKGMVGINSGNRYFQFADGDIYYPMGVDMSVGGLDSYARVQKMLSKVAAHKVNFGRFAPLDAQIQVPYSNGLNNNYSGWGIYNLPILLALDEMIELGEKYSIYYQCCLFNLPAAGNGWESSIYNINKDPQGLVGLTSNTDFFKSVIQGVTTQQVLVKKRCKDLIRYCIARYGWSTNIMSWELFNEVDLISNFTVVAEEYIEPWYNEIIAYMRTIDYQDRMITSSFSAHDFTGARTPYENILDALDLDFTQVHFFQNDSMDIDIANQSVSPVLDKITRWEKPCFAGFSGISTAYYNKAQIWSSCVESCFSAICSGASGSPVYYNINHLYQHNIFDVFDYAHKIISKFGNDITDTRHNILNASFASSVQSENFDNYLVPLDYNVSTDAEKSTVIALKTAELIPTVAEILVDSQSRTHAVSVIVDATNAVNQTLVIFFTDGAGTPQATTRNIKILFMVTEATGGAQIKVDATDGIIDTELFYKNAISDNVVNKYVSITIPTGSIAVRFSNPYVNPADPSTIYRLGSMTIFGGLENQISGVYIKSVLTKDKMATFTINRRRNFVNKFMVDTNPKILCYPNNTPTQLFDATSSPILSGGTETLKDISYKQAFISVYDPMTNYSKSPTYSESQTTDYNKVEINCPDIDSYQLLITTFVSRVEYTNSDINFVKEVLDRPNSISTSYLPSKIGKPNTCPYCDSLNRLPIDTDDVWKQRLYYHLISEHQPLFIEYLRIYGGELFSGVNKELLFLRDNISQNSRVKFSVIDGTFMCEKNLYNTGIETNQSVKVDSFGDMPTGLEEEIYYYVKIISWYKFELYDGLGIKISVSGTHINLVTPYYLFPAMEYSNLETFAQSNASKISSLINLVEEVNSDITALASDLNNIDIKTAKNNRRTYDKLLPNTIGVFKNTNYLPVRKLPIVYPVPYSDCFLYMTFQDYVVGSNTLLDTSGAGNNGTRTGTSFITEGNKKILVFDKVNHDRVLIPRQTSFYPAELSICLWFKSTNLSEQRLICNKPTDSTQTGWEIYTTGGYVEFVWGQDAVKKAIYYQNVGYFDGNWHCLCATLNTSRAAVYVDGVEVKYLAWDLVHPLHFEDSNINLSLGSRNASSYWYNGSLAIVQLYNRDIGYGGVKQYYYDTYNIKEEMPE